MLADPDPRTRRLVLANANRQAIMAAIEGDPGIHLRALARRLGLAAGTIEHHVRTMVGHGLIVAYQDGRRKGFYANHAGVEEDLPWLHALGRPAQRAILAHLAHHDDDVHGLVVATGLRDAQAFHHLRRLRDAGLVRRIRIGRASLYVANDRPRLQRLLIPDPLVHVWSRARAIEEQGPRHQNLIHR